MFYYGINVLLWHSCSAIVTVLLTCSMLPNITRIVFYKVLSVYMETFFIMNNIFQGILDIVFLSSSIALVVTTISSPIAFDFIDQFLINFFNSISLHFFFFWQSTLIIVINTVAAHDMLENAQLFIQKFG